LQTLLATDVSPMKIGRQGFEVFFSEHFRRATKVSLITGYVSEEGLADLILLASQHPGLEEFELFVGMAKFDGISGAQLRALNQLNNSFREGKIGGVYVPTALPVHAKISRFTGEGADGLDRVAIIGSSNLSALDPDLRQWNAEIATDDADVLAGINASLEQLRKISQPLDSTNLKIKIIQRPEVLLQDQEGVETTRLRAFGEPTATWQLPLKCTEKSNLNVYFGKGRSKGRLQRTWYEVEIIPGESITKTPGYPSREMGAFQVITDDGWAFDCKVSGGPNGNKNFRSARNLQTLGKWIKGRLELDGLLTPGEKVTEEILSKYGRSSLTLSYFASENLWTLDFSKGAEA